MKLKLTVLFLFVLSHLAVNAQECFITITRPASDTTICQGDSVYLRSEGSCNIFLNGGFENGLGPGWTSSYPTPIYIDEGCDDEYYPFGPGPNGNYGWFGPTGQMVQPRHITTDTFDLSMGGACNLKFWMRYGRAAHAGNSDCEDPNNPDNGLHLQYSLDFGTTWFDFPGVNQYPTGPNEAYPPFHTLVPGSGGYWQPTQENPVGGFHVPERYDTSAVYWWHQYSCSIPPAAMTPTTMFRFMQDFHQAAKTDTWGIDEVLLWCADNQDVVWSHGPMEFNPPDPVAPTVTTDYIVTVYDSLGNFASDTVTITVIPVPDPDLGPDTAVCDNGANTAYFDAGPGYDEYLWNTGETTQVITPNTTGWYTVTATNNGMCSGTDSVYLQMIPMVVANAGSDALTCEETPFDLSASSTPPTASDYSSILWYGGLGTFDDPTALAPIYTPAPGEYGQVILTMVAYGNSPCGNDTSQMILDVIIIPDPDLGPDTTICDNGINAAYFDAGPGYDEYLWNTGETTQVITPNTTGWYTVTATNNNLCSGTDSVHLQMIPMVVADAGSDEVTCEETPFDLSASSIPPTASDYSSVLWSGGLGTFNDPAVIAPIYAPAPGEIGQVILTMVAYGNAPCGNDTSQMILDVVPNAIANAGSDESICRGEPFDFATSSIVPYAANYDTLYWTGGSGSFIDPTAVVPVYIPDPAELGQITLTLVTSGLISNCDSVDEMVLTIYPDYLTVIDTTICFLDSLFVQGNWQNTTGIYYDTLQTVHACDSVIQTNLTVRPEIDYDFIIDPQSVCLGEVTYFYQSGSSTIVDFLWDFGDGQTSPILDPTHIYSNIGNFHVTLSYTDDNGCSDEKTHLAHVMLQAEVDFTSSGPVACLYEPVNFNGFSTFNIIQWDWDFGDGHIGSGQNVSHSYNAPGSYNVTLTGYTTSGCEGTMVHSIYIPPSPVADFAHYIVYCDSIQFTDLSYHPSPGYNIVEWDWDFGDGGTSVLQHPWHQFDNSGIFYVTLIATSDSAGLLCSDTITKPVTVPPKPTLYFTWDGDPTCFGTPTSFYGTSGGNIVSWYWSFGDGVTATGQHPVHLFTSIDTFDVVLTVTDVNGCSDSIIHSVEVVDLPDVDFSVLPNPTCRNSLTLFEGNSTVNVENWTWDFGDGSYGVGQFTAHTYLQAGTYNVVLSVNDSIGCDNGMSYPVVVNNLPTADFAFNETTCSNDTVYLTDFSSTPNGYIQQWDWDLGDGTLISIQYPDDPDISYAYPMGGNYTITLTVTDSDSCSHTYSRQIEIESSPIANFNHPPACDGSPVYFTDLSSINGGSPLLTWYWEFDDPNSGSNTSTQPNPAHLFSSSGTYYVSLVVTNLINCADTIVKMVEVNGLPEVDFLISTDTACIDAEVEFTSLSPEAVSCWWDFGDGGTSVQINPVHVYQYPGDYTVTLTVVDGYGCSNSVSHILTVDPLPWAAFDYSDLTCTSVPVLFNDESSATSGYLAQWHWYFGDGTDTIIYYPDNPDVYHAYANSDLYTVSLVITSSNGCIDSTSNDIHIIQGPVSVFTYSGNDCAEETIEFYDLSYAFGVPIVSWQWDFGDPSSGPNNASNLQNPTHVFEEAGTYTVTLQATMAGGCYGVSSQEVVIEPKPPVYFYTGPSTCYPDLTYFFTDPDSTNISEVTAFLWEFDDPGSGASNLSTLQDPTHMFTAPGNYDVSLTITDIDGCHNTITRQIVVGEKPTADFAFISPCVGDSTQFIDQSYGVGTNIVGWLWNFDDPASGQNNTSSLQNPYHKFSETGSYAVRLVVTDVNGCMDSMDKVIQINESPLSLFSYSSSCDPPGSVVFKDLSLPGSPSQPIVGWYWELEPGIYSYQTDPQHVYDYTDTCYQVSLTVTDQQGCQNTKIQEVCVNGPLHISIASEDVCLGERTLFHAIYQASNDTVVAWVWDFNDGSPIIHTEYDTISHQFTQPGAHTVKVSGFNPDGCEFTAHEEIIVNRIPVADFTATVANCNDVTEFTDLSTAPGSAISTWSWDFGDGSHSNAPSPIHQYGIQDSTYLVTLTVANVEGCIDSIQKEVVKGACLVAAFEPVLQSPCHNLAACFVDQSVLHSGEYPIVKWDWAFGDGTTESYSYYRDSICHLYNNSGNYQVELIVTAMVNGVEQRDTASRNVQFALAPEAAFSFQKPCVNNGTKFIDETSGNGMMITSWQWDFGDYYSSEDTSSLQNPAYNYIFPGTYQVRLVTANSFGCSDTLFREIQIYGSPQVDFTYAKACTGKKTIFTDASSPAMVPIKRWSWDFGDVHSTTDTSNQQNPQYVYKQAGEYPVILEITDENQCEDIIRKVIAVYPAPISRFEILSNYEGIYGNVLMENYSQGAVNYMWDFDNGETSELENPQVFYDENGTYIIQLVTKNEYDCFDTAYQQVEIVIQGLFVPNAFVPEDQNPELRTFKPIGINLRKYKIEIFNRWGAVIWSSMKLDDEGSPAESWDGTYKGKLLPVGDYIWLIEAEFKNGHKWQGSDVGDGNNKTYGTVTLIR